jgi:hypothetical protein
MDTCFFCNEAIENEDEYILIGLVQDETPRAAISSGMMRGASWGARRD